MMVGMMKPPSRTTCDQSAYIRYLSSHVFPYLMQHHLNRLARIGGHFQSSHTKGG